MRIRGRLLLMLMLGLLAGCTHAPVTVTDTDPHRWLESPASSPRVQAWLQQQAQSTQNWQQQQPNYHRFREQLHAAWDHPKWMVAAIQRDQVFFYFNPGLEDHYSLYQQSYPAFIADRARGLAPVGRARRLLGNDTFADNTNPGAISISPDAQWLAYQVNRWMPSGNQQSLWYLQSLADTTAAPLLLSVEHKVWTLPAEQLAWGRDSGRVFFTVSAPPVTGPMAAPDTLTGSDWQSRVYAWRVNGSIPAAELIYLEAASRHIEQLHVSDSGLLIAVADQASGVGDSNTRRWAVIEPDKATIDAPARASRLSLQPTRTADRHAAQFVGDIGGVPAFLARGVRGTGAIMLADTRQSRTLIPESEVPLLSALVLGEKLVLEYLVHGSSTLQVVDLDGRSAGDNDALVLPAPVRIEALRAAGEHELLVSFSGMLTPPRSVLVDLRNGQQTILTSDQPDVPLSDLRASLFRVDTRDGVRVPVWVTSSGAMRGGDDDLMLLEVYGGFASPMETSFSISRLVWVANGGALAIAGPRGGGDYGASWHVDGSGERRVNSIADVLAVAGWLRDERLTDNGRLAVSGRSHGGLLAAEVVLRAPDLFSALVTDAAVFDLMRLDALGGAGFWQQEYHGATSSPYQMLLSAEPGPDAHPPALLVTRANDTVVAPAHSFKYVQALQAKLSSAPADALLAVTPGRGHGSSERVADMIDDYALRWTFLSRTGVKD
ncbi:prolyl oligopeptidase family serine peptidase [Pseudohongiella sp.]|uniref:Peptidase S9 prolyl oligopeptidase catalytic domain-containing protein n=1 Tax=marine sediment metagenome TaxID=412755 RepID=A0A0F9YLA7_9ZZZZ|nr:prolyl oligopeptidase family serine peptidase [Pseudohongiella sp.]HDZ10461.1 S9 family peptidase [Pseudohongiella sp.]